MDKAPRDRPPSDTPRSISASIEASDIQAQGSLCIGFSGVPSHGQPAKPCVSPRSRQALRGLVVELPPVIAVGIFRTRLHRSFSPVRRLMLMRVVAHAVIGSPRPVLTGGCFAFGFKQAIRIPRGCAKLQAARGPGRDLSACAYYRICQYSIQKSGVKARVRCRSTNNRGHRKAPSCTPSLFPLPSSIFQPPPLHDSSNQATVYQDTGNMLEGLPNPNTEVSGKERGREPHP